MLFYYFLFHVLVLIAASCERNTVNRLTFRKTHEFIPQNSSVKVEIKYFLNN